MIRFLVRIFVRILVRILVLISVWTSIVRVVSSLVFAFSEARFYYRNVVLMAIRVLRVFRSTSDTAGRPRTPVRVKTVIVLPYEITVFVVILIEILVFRVYITIRCFLAIQMAGIRVASTIQAFINIEIVNA